MYLFHGISDSVVILLVVIFNATIGTFQEHKAQGTLSSLRHLSQTESVVHRDGIQKVIDSRELVPTDILSLREGDKIPADATIITSKSFTVDEASLTGESIPLQRKTGESVYMATFVRTGLATCVVSKKIGRAHV